jgi:MFS family permease
MPVLADVTPSEIRGSGYGLGTALYTVGAVAGPLTAIGTMTHTGDNYRLVFWLAVIPGFLSIAVLVIGVEEVSDWPTGLERQIIMRRSDLQLLTPVFWWAVSIAALLALARCSQAFLLLKAGSVGIDPAFVPIVIVLMNLVYLLSAYPCGVLADKINRRLQLGVGVAVLIGADLVLIFAHTIWLTAIGAALWGLQMGLIQGLFRRLSPMRHPVRYGARHSRSMMWVSGSRRLLRVSGLARSGSRAAPRRRSAPRRRLRSQPFLSCCFGPCQDLPLA